MLFLRQNTASQEVLLPRMVDSTDGNTPETGLTINNTDIQLFKSGATSLVNKNSGGATHLSNGDYMIVLDATDTNTIGSLVITCHPTGALYTRTTCVVLDEAVYDVLFGTVAPATVTEINTVLDQLDVIQTKTDTLGTGRVTVVSPLSSDGNTLQIVQGDSYLLANSRALEWTDDDDLWPDLTSASIALVIHDGTLVAAGTVVVASGAGKQVRVQLTSAQTSPLKRTEPRTIPFQVKATLSSGEVVTLVRGLTTIVDSETS